MTKIFFDTEFTGLHQNTTLISIGLVAETGKTFYAEFTDYDKNQVDSWIKENVIKNLTLQDWLGDMRCVAGTNGNDTTVIGPSSDIIKYLKAWLFQFEEVEMWSDCLSYDWVLFCELWGGALEIPSWIYYIPFDICTLFKEKGINPDIQREEFAYGDIKDMTYIYELSQEYKKHNALWDAKVIKACYDKLNKLKNGRENSIYSY